VSNEIATTQDQYPMTANAVIARVRRIQEIKQAVMKKDTHFGLIPGCKKESLYKPGAEMLLLTFRIAAEPPIVEDLSTADAIRYRVTRNGAVNGVLVASGIGECSSDEEKYKWRKSVCDEEFTETPEDRRREKWVKPYEKAAYKIKQVRTQPADVANTILKMADKRGYVAMSILATAAGDIFTQDIEDLPPEIAEGLEEGSAPAKEPIKAAVKKEDAPNPAPSTNGGDHPTGGPVISEAQAKRFYAIAKGSGKSNDDINDYCGAKLNIKRSSEMQKSDYESACVWAAEKSQAGDAQE
jgi:hypothetical protein